MERESMHCQTAITAFSHSPCRGTLRRLHPPHLTRRHRRRTATIGGPDGPEGTQRRQRGSSLEPGVCLRGGKINAASNNALEFTFVLTCIPKVKRVADEKQKCVCVRGEEGCPPLSLTRTHKQRDSCYWNCHIVSVQQCGSWHKQAAI